MAKQTPTNVELCGIIPIIPDCVDIIGEYIGSPLIIVIDSRKINIPLIHAENGFIIDWGDDSIYEYINNAPIRNINHQYKNCRKNIIHIYSHGLTEMSFVNIQKEFEITQWGSIKLRTGHKMFTSCPNLSINAIDSPNLTFADDISYMFSQCANLSGDLNNWDVRHVKNMCTTFGLCRNCNIDVSKWNVSSVENMNSMFTGCITFKSDLSRWVTHNVTNMRNMFTVCRRFKSDLSNWNVSNVKDAYCMFSGCREFNSDLSRWDMANVKDMTQMFGDCLSFDSDLSGWNICNALHMDHIFYNCKKLNTDLCKWNIENVESISYALRGTQMPPAKLIAWNLKIDRENDMRILAGRPLIIQ